MPRAEGGEYELVLENRHVLGIFLAAAALCGVFFALGYIVGKNTGAPYTPPPQATAVAPSEGRKSAMPAPPPAETQPPEQAAESKQPPTEQPAAAPQAAAPAAEQPAQEQANPAAAGAITLQVAALSKKEDADAMAAVLKDKNFPVTISTGAGDKLHHVLVGPYESAKDADAAKARLEKEGFKPLLKR